MTGLNNKNYVRMDEGGTYRVGGTRVSLDSVIYAYMEGNSAEEIAVQYSALSLEEVYGAITYFLANKDEVNRYLRGREKLWDEFRAQAEAQPSPVIQRLRALKAGKPQVKQ